MCVCGGGGCIAILGFFVFRSDGIFFYLRLKKDDNGDGPPIYFYTIKYVKAGNGSG